jgi:hypothetical protein
MFLGNDCETSNYTTAIGKWELRKQACFNSNNGRDVFYMVHAEML